MFDKFVANFLTSYLGRYFSNIDREHVKVSFWRGDVVLENLLLRKNALRGLELPILVKSGTVGLLKVYIPWTALRSQSVRIEVSKVNIIVHPKKAAAYDAKEEEEDRYEAKLEALASFESMRQEEENRKQQAVKGSGKAPDDDLGAADDAVAEEMAKDASFMQRLKATMLNNVQITVKDVRIIYEDVVTDPAKPIQMGLHLEAFTVRSCDNEWQPYFAASTEKFFYKIMLAEQLRLTVAIRNHSAEEDDPASDIEIFPPVDLTMRAQHQPLPFQPEIPRWLIDVDTANMKLSINREQWDAIWRSIRYVQQFDQMETFRMFRPATATYTKGAARAWWNFAIQSVLSVVRKERQSKHFDWQKFVQLKKDQAEYTELHKRRQKAEWLLPLTEAEGKRVIELEKRLPLPLCQRGRQFAYARLKLEEAQHRAKVEYIQRKQAVKRKATGWWGTAVNWWSGADAKAKRDVLAEADEVEDNEADEEAIQAFGIIDSEKWTAEQRRILAKEFGIEEDDSATASVSPLVAAHAKTIRLSASIPLFQIDLLDYRGNHFFAFKTKRSRFGYDATENTWKYSYQVDDYIAVDPARGSAILQIAADRIDKDKEPRPAITATFGRGAMQRDDGVEYSLFMELQPAIATISVPLLQKCIAFWGVKTTLTTYGKPAEFGEKVPLLAQLGMKREKQTPVDIQITLLDCSILILDVDPQSGSTVLDPSKLQPSGPSDSAEGFELDGDSSAKKPTQWISLNLPMLTVTTDAAEEVRRNKRLVALSRQSMRQEANRKKGVAAAESEDSKSAEAEDGETMKLPLMSVLAEDSLKFELNSPSKGKKAKGSRPLQTIAPSSPSGPLVEGDDWVNKYCVTVCGVSIDAYWGNGQSECRVVQEFDGVITTRQSIVKRHYGVPLFDISLAVHQPLILESDRSGLFVVMSVVSLITEFVNNASGRGAAYEEVAPSRHVVDQSRLSAEEAGLLRSFRCVVQGPYPRYMYNNDRFLKEVQLNPQTLSQYEQSSAPLWRYVEIQRGEVLLYHEHRPSMVATRMDLVANVLHVEVEANVLHLFVPQGGTPHSTRRMLDNSEGILARYKVPRIASWPQQKAAAELLIPSLSADAAAELKAALSIIEQVSESTPCQCLSFSFANATEVNRLKASLFFYSKLSKVLSPPLVTPRMMPAEQQRQQLFSLTIQAPAVEWILAGDAVEKVKVRTQMTDVSFAFQVYPFSKRLTIGANQVSQSTNHSHDPIILVNGSKSHPTNNIPLMGLTDSHSSAGSGFSLLFETLLGAPNSLVIALGSTPNDPVELVLCQELIQATELLWDSISIFLMRHLSWTQVMAIPFTTSSGVSYNPNLDPTLTVEVRAGGVAMLGCYAPREDAPVNDGPPTRVACFKLSGKDLLLRWSVSAAANTTDVQLKQPDLTLLYPGHSKTHDKFLKPAGHEEGGHELTQVAPSESIVSFTYQILYKPNGMSDQRWLLSQNPLGFTYTHHLSMQILGATMCYRQTALWWLLEYFSNNPLLFRMSYLGWRPKFTLTTIPDPWPPRRVPPPQYGFQMLHMHIEAIDCVVELPHAAELPIQLSAYCPSMQVTSAIRPAMGTDGPIGAEVQHGTVMTLVGLDLIRRLDRTEQREPSILVPPVDGIEGRVLFSPTAPGIRTLATGFTTGFEIWFETASLQKLFSEKHLELNMHELVFTGSSEDLALLLEWNCWCFMEPFTGYYPPKQYPDKPFPILRRDLHQRRGKEESPLAADTSPAPVWVTYDWKIAAERLCFHLMEEGEGTVLDLVQPEMTLAWSNDTSFISTYRIPRVEGWDLAPSRHSQNKQRLLRFVSEVNEIAHNRDKFLQLENLGVLYGWTSGEGKRLFSDVEIESFTVNLLPNAIQTLRDSIWSLKVRNGIAPMFKWPQYAPNQPKSPPADPSLQLWTVEHTIHCRLCTIVLFANPADATSQPILHCALQDLTVNYTTEKYGLNDSLKVNLRTIVCGVVDHTRTVWPFIVPKGELNEKGQISKDKPPPLLTLSYGSQQGLEGELAHTWIMAPAAEWIKQCKNSVQHVSMAKLGTVGTFAEERGNANKDTDEVMPAKKPTPADGISIRLHRPCIVVTEFQDTHRGVVASLGEIVIQRVIKVVDTEGREPSTTRRSSMAMRRDPSSARLTSLEARTASALPGTGLEYEEDYLLSISHANVTSLHQSGHYLLQPMSAELSGRRTVDGETTLRVKIEALVIDIAQEYYESLMHGAVRHLVKDEDALLDQKLQDEDATFVERGTLSSDHLKGDTDRSSTASPSGTVVSRTGRDRSETKIKEHDAARTEREAKAFREAKEALKQQATLHGDNLKRQSTNITVAWDRFAMRVHSEQVAVVLCTGTMGTTVESDDMLWKMSASVEKVELGVEGQRMLLTITNPDSALTLNTETDLLENVKTVTANLGTTSMYLSESALVPAITFLYEPYRRIVVPRYGLTDVTRIDNHHTLTERLVLSTRKMMHCTSTQYNRIQIDCNGQEVHFISPGQKPVMMVDAGLTVEFINGRIHLYEADLETYVVCGNGGYVLCEEESNAIIRTEKPIQPTWKVTSAADGGARYVIQSAICITLPEVDDNSGKKKKPQSQGDRGLQRAASMHHPQVNSRALVLGAMLDVGYETTIAGGVGTEKGRFLIQALRADCLYYSAAKAVSDTSSLISSWDLEVELMGETTQDESLSRAMKVFSEQDVDIRVRFGDLMLALNSINRAKAALGQVESSMGVDVGSDETQLKGNQQSLKNDTTAISITFPRVGFTILLRTEETSLHVNYTIRLDYYNEEVCTWFPLIEPVEGDIVLRQVKALTLSDLKRRKGDTRAGLRLRALQLRFTPIAAKCAKRLLELVQMLSAPKQTDGQQGSSAPQQAGKQGTREQHQEFFMYTIQQKVAPELTVSFAGQAENYDMIPRDEGRDLATTLASTVREFNLNNTANSLQLQAGGVFEDVPPEETPFNHPKLPLNETLSFNFPRINGREIPVQKHEIQIQTAENKGTFCVGTVGVRLGPRILGHEMIIDVALKNGQKTVLLRSNVTFQNKLSFSICLEGVGEVKPGARFALPAEAMRRRVVLCPLVKEPCLEASLGVHYESLQYLYDQTFLCQSPITDQRNPQDAYYYFLRFGPRKVLRLQPQLLDAQGVFEPPMTIINNTGVPCDVALYSKCSDNGARKSGLKFQAKYYYKHVATHAVDPQGSLPVVQINPLESIYIDLVLKQPNGSVLTRAGGKADSRPSLIHCPDLPQRDSTLTVYDQDGQALIIDIEYTDNTVKLYCKYWIINQMQHYIQIADEKPSKSQSNLAGALTAGQGGEGVPPTSTPFLINTDRHNKKEKCHVYIRMGFHTSRGDIMWSQWSGKLDISTVSSLNLVNCGESGEVYTFSYSVGFVGGTLKDTRVITVTPRWIIINRCSQTISLFQDTSLKDNGMMTLPHQHSNTIDTAKVTGHNMLRMKYCDDENVVGCEWSDEFCIDKLADYSLNLCYEPRHSPSRQEFSVVRVSCYSRGSILYVAVDKSTKPPYLIENRTRFVVAVKQLDTTRELVVYPRTTKGFVWENAQAPPIISVCAWEATIQNTSLATRNSVCVMNLDPKVIARRRYTLAQELILPGGIVLYVRVRGYGNSFAISVTTETAIDRCRTLPYLQISGRLQIDSIAISAGAAKELVLISLMGPKGQPALSLSASQVKNPTEDIDEQRVEFKMGSLQVDDERKDALHGVVLQSTLNKISEVSVIRRMDRSSPVLNINQCEALFQPIQIHLEDGFLFEAIRLFREFQQCFGVQTDEKQLHKFDTAPWLKELELSTLQDSSYLWRIVFVERLFIEQFLVSISLYRGGNAQQDPIREQLGILSVMIRTVQDARLDWRRIENSELSDKLWLLLVFIGNYYLLELQHQIFNLVHIAGLDAMRSIVTDLLEGYFSPSTSHIDRNQRLIRRREQVVKVEANEESLAEWEKIEDFEEDLSGAQAGLEHCRCRWVEKQRKKGHLARNLVKIHEYAHHTAFEEFVVNCTLQEIRQHGELSLANALRRRPMEGPHPPKSACRRCDEIERIRARRAESGAMSLLPLPHTGELEWVEYCHHVSWSDFVFVCSLHEIQKYGSLVKDSLLGSPYNVVRVEGKLAWCLKGSL
jgi:hypothetical protein